MSDICDEKGRVTKQNISREKMKARSNLLKRLNEGEILVVPTDKSGRLSVTISVEAMQPHVANDATVSLKEMDDIGRKLI